jgi:alpha-tubulin suppressor-like RCC1 family protein
MSTPGTDLRVTVALCALLLTSIFPGTATASPVVGSTSIDPVVRIVQIAAGAEHTCAVTDTGGVMCWGKNQYGQVGDGTTIDRFVPVAVSGLSSGVSKISLGSYHSCALLDTGGVKCWGENSYGELGDGTSDARLVPVNVSGLNTGVSAISAGSSHTCALSGAGAVLCWGNNSDGQLGNGTTVSAMTPMTVTGFASGGTAIVAGYQHSCALAGPDHVKCWGYNGSGQLGDGTTTNSLAPVEVSGIGISVTALAVGDSHTCVLTSTGGVKCWGSNSYGELGDDTHVDSRTPVNVSGLSSGVAALNANGDYTCVILSTGSAKCWGKNWYGLLGDGTTSNRYTPVSVNGLGNGIVMISAGGLHTCALTNTGVGKCWGANFNGELGNGTITNQYQPVNVSGVSGGTVAVAAGGSHTCAINSAGGATCWGNNASWQLGVYTDTSRYLPVGVTWMNSGATAIVAGAAHNCVLTSTGGVKCWGNNMYGQLGSGSTLDQLVPMPVSGLSSGVIALSTESYHTCALMSGGGVKCWGLNNSGQLGDGTTTDRYIPVAVSGLSSGVVAIVAAGGHTCAIVTGGGVKCWGANSSGQLGDGTKTDRLTPVAVSGLSSGVIAVSGSNVHSCAVTSGGAVKCWGLNNVGQLGDGTTIDHLTPAPVSGLTTGVTAIASERAYTCALTNAGAVKCWGGNDYGVLGNGTTNNQLVPVSVIGLNSGVTAISAGFSHVCALMRTGGVKCWGDNGDGQLGVDPGWTPVVVRNFGLAPVQYLPQIR